MHDHFRFETQQPASSTTEALCLQGIIAHAAKTKNMSPIRSFSIVVKEGETSIGGITGVTYYGCLYVDMLWVAEQMRHYGIGKELMQQAETLGRDQQCTFATVSTMDWEALPFYESLGYTIEFVREGYLQNSKLFMLRKNIF